MTRKKRILIALLALVVACIGLLHVNYPLSYVFNVMVRQGPDYGDFQVFPASYRDVSSIVSCDQSHNCGVFELQR